jgi:acyl carrier protein
MDIDDFIGKFAEQFDETDASEFKTDTEFKGLVDWSSMVALSIIAMIDEEYSVVIGGDDIRKATTVENLFNIVNEYKTNG